MKLIVFDMDGVIFDVHNFWMELHRVFGTYKKGKEYTEKYLYDDYGELVQRVVAELWKGKSAEPYFKLINGVKYYKGVMETFKELKRRGYLIVSIVTCGPSHLVERLKRDLAEISVVIDYSFSNELVIENGKVKGEFLYPVAEGKKKKVKILEKICKKERVELTDVVAVADGVSDLELLKVAGLKIAFMPTSDKIRKVADVVIEKPDLREVLKYID